jgi:hypothetical protein
MMAASYHAGRDADIHDRNSLGRLDRFARRRAKSVDFSGHSPIRLT